MKIFARYRWCCATAFVVLTGCWPYTEPATGEYAALLRRGEKVTRADTYGRFAALSVEYRQGGGSLMSTENHSMRLIHKDKIVVKATEGIERWTDFAQPVYFVKRQEDDGMLALVHEQAGKAVVEKITASEYGYRGNETYMHGFPLSPGVRYFPVDQRPGFLLRGLPLKTTVLPSPPEGSVDLHAQVLAAISPDGTSFAFVDSEYAPSVVLVVDADGKRRDPIPLPRIYLADAPTYQFNPYERLWAWSRTALAWHKNGAGSWEVRPDGVAPGAAGAHNVVEQLFISDQTGYRTCFAAANAACLPGWRGADAAEQRKTFVWGGDAPPFAYVPVAPAAAFGARVGLLLLSGGCCRVPSYHLYLDGAPAAVAAQLSARLRESKTPFVRVDECPRRTGNDGKCEAQLAQRLKRPESLGRELEQLLDTWDEHDGVLFVMPSMAVAVRANEQGGSVIQTLLRADLSRRD
ncbi:hypothetical protein [Janthinobacterium lividum]|uniref:hypothetical protein n=1 Tax=Janthinobacterium lividum TaxID=29581 RepID=UPI00140A915D|nr:hypothetical protein [Janthinobacterium lividum]NHQ90217.1 hypothetical protein [Janthinobacterium lividum]